MLDFSALGLFFKMTFVRDFHIESKELQVSINAKGLIKLSEWSLKSVHSTQMWKFAAVWMVNMTDKLLKAGTCTNFALKFNEAHRGFLAQCCSNKGGRYVAVVEYGGGRKQGVVTVPEGKNGHG